MAVAVVVLVVAVAAVGVLLGAPLHGGAQAAPTVATVSSAVTQRAAAAAQQAAALNPPPTSDAAAPGSQVPVPIFESDPFTIASDGFFFLYASGGPQPGAAHIPVSTSADFTTWSAPTDALPVLPPWASPGLTWAPDVHRFGNRWALYFTSAYLGITPETECVGSAFADRPTGPFVAQPTPIVCQTDLGGTIDPRVFVDSDGSPWLLYKSEQNRGGADVPTQMWSQRLSADGSRLIGTPHLLLAPDRSWQGTIVEAPQLLLVHGAYWLFYSANWFNGPHYAVGVARCLGPAGPCADVTPGPLLATNDQGAGPGEASVFRDRAGLWLLYSPRRSLAPKPDIPPRPIYIARLGVGPAGPYLASGPLPGPTDLLGSPLWASPGGGTAPE